MQLSNDIKQKEHFYWLDAIRFFAAFMVLFSHSRIPFFLAWGDLPIEDKNTSTFIFYTLGRLGHEAVIIFFVLSGFLVGGVGFKRIFSNNFNTSSYFIDRSVRILLPLISAILFFVIVSILLGNHIDLITILGNLLSLQGVFVNNLVAPFWSLSYEVWFYIFIGAIGFVASQNDYQKKLYGFIIFSIVAIIFVSGLKAHYLLIWLMGAVSYLSRPEKFNKWIFSLSIIGFILFVALWQICKDSDSLSIPFKIDNKELIEIIMSLFFCLFIQQVILIKPSNKLTKLIEIQFGKLACFSYTLYLCHPIIFLLIWEYIYDKGTYDISFINILKWISVMLIAMLGSYIIYLFAEKHTYRVKRIIKEKLNLK